MADKKKTEIVYMDETETAWCKVFDDRVMERLRESDGRFTRARTQALYTKSWVFWPQAGGLGTVPDLEKTLSDSEEWGPDDVLILFSDYDDLGFSLAHYPTFRLSMACCEGLSMAIGAGLRSVWVVTSRLSRLCEDTLVASFASEKDADPVEEARRLADAVVDLLLNPREIEGVSMFVTHDELAAQPVAPEDACYDYDEILEMRARAGRRRR